MAERNDSLLLDPDPRFGLLLRQLRRRAGLTQAEFAAAVHLSTAQVSRLEQDERLPNVEAVAHQFVPALGLDDDPRLARRLVELAAAARGEALAPESLAGTLPPAPAGTSLPILPTRVVGRAAFLAQAQQRLLDRDGRLLTLLGPPGIGKTTVALALAAQVQDLFAHGAVFVGLAPVQDAAQVSLAILNALGFHDNSQALAPRRQLLAYLRAKHLLLVLDNFEHLTPAAALVGELLAAAPGLFVLVTSRAPLRLRAERRLRVPPLQPEAAVELFVARAQAIEADFDLTPANRPVVTDLCAGLDYLPLAIELAASRVDLLTPGELLAQAQENRLLATGQGAVDQEAHHQTLRAAIDRSYALLTPAQQRLFRLLGVFVGGFDLAAVQTVVRELGYDAAEDGSPAAVAAHLTALVQRSVVAPSRRGPGASRFFLLETLRAFAMEQLAAAGEQAAIQAAHARMILGLAARSQAGIAAAPQTWWHDLEENQENLRAALTWLLAHDRPAALQLAVWLQPYWELRGRQREARQWLAQVLAAPNGDTALPLPLLAEGLRQAGNFAQQLSDFPQAQQLLAQAHAVYTQLDDAAGVAATRRAQGWLAADMGEHQGAVDAFTQSLALYRQVGDAAMTAKVLSDLVHVLGDPAHDYRLAQSYATESLTIARRLGDSVLIAYALQQAGINEARVGHYAEAAAAYAEALELLRRMQAVRELGWALEQLGEAMWYLGEVDAAQSYWTEALELFTAHENDHGVMMSHHHLAQVARVQGAWDEARRRYTTCLRMCWEWQNLAMVARCLAGLGGVLTAHTRLAPAAQFLAVARRLIDELPPFLAPADERELHQLVDDLAAAAGADRFAQLWAQGSQVGVEETVALALSLGGSRA